MRLAQNTGNFSKEITPFCAGANKYKVGNERKNFSNESISIRCTRILLVTEKQTDDKMHIYIIRTIISCYFATQIVIKYGKAFEYASAPVSS